MSMFELRVRIKVRVRLRLRVRDAFQKSQKWMEREREEGGRGILLRRD